MKRNSLYGVAWSILTPIFRFLYRMKIIHPEYLPKNGKVIVCSNHLALKDPFFLAVSLNRQICFMAKVELFKNKVLAYLIRSLGGFPVNRGKGDSAALETAKNILNDDRILGIFIEGTRSKDGNFLKPKSGVSILSYATGAPILPVCITCPSGGKPRLFKRVIVSFGELIHPSELNIQEGSSCEYRSASRYIMNKIASLRERDVSQSK